MSHTVRLGLSALPFLIIALFVPLAPGQEKKLKELQWSHAFDLACRQFGKGTFEKDTPRFGVEAFRDNNTGLGVYISEKGTMSLAPNFAALNPPLRDSKGPTHLTGLDLPARKAGEKKFQKSTKVHCMEAFRDPNTDDWLFVTDKGLIAAADGKLFPGVNNKQPKWVHSVDLQVRKGGIKEWKDAAKFGIEVYKDGNTGNLVYLTEHGHIAIIPETKEVKGDGTSPEWLHGLDLSCRRHDEKSFNKDTRKFGVEVYHDVFTGNLIFISETGSIGVAPASANVAAPTPKAKQPTWTHGLNIKARPFGKADFDQAIPFGAEVFRDDNVNVILYINELGNITVQAAK